LAVGPLQEIGMKYNIHYDIAATVLAVIILIHYYSHRKRIKMPQTRVFKGLLWLSLATDIADICTVLIDTYRLPTAVVNLVNVIYLVFFNALPFLYYLYLFKLIKGGERCTKSEKMTIYAPVSWTVLLIVTSPWTRLIFYYNLEEGYCHGAGFPLLYIATVLYILGSVGITVRFKSRLTVWQRLSVYFYLLASGMGILVQIAIPKVLMLQFAVSLSLLLLYMSLENPDDDMDKVLGLHNRRGFDKVVRNAVADGESFNILVAAITNFPIIRDMAGVDFCQSMMKQAVAGLTAGLDSCELFSLSDGRVAVMADQQAQLGQVLASLRQEFAKTVTFGDMDIRLQVSILQINFPDEVSTIEDIMDSIDFSLVLQAEDNSDEVLHCSGEILKSRRRENRIQQAMQHALENSTFKVYYQPIYSTEKKRYTSAEALVRLFDDELGMISPDEFIPLAEKNGMIIKIGEVVFRTVCEMMARQKIWEKGIEYIEVNLSMIQCMQEDICDMMYCVMDEFGVPYSCINLEATESVIAQDMLWGTMERMCVGGVTFSLDDYGTGYSNLTNVLKYPFHIVKLDKSMVWYAMENEYAMCALRHTVEMMQELNKHIVAEGVETKEQWDILEEMGCHYLQGYYFSKPVPEAEFLEKLS